MTAFDPYAWLGVTERAAPAVVHQAAAAKLHLVGQDIAAGRLDMEAAARAYTDVYAAVMAVLGLRLGHTGQLDDVGTFTVASGAGAGWVWAMTQATTPEQPSWLHPTSTRLPCECEICGWFPAVPVSVTWVLTILFVAKVRRETKVLCRDCGLNTVRRAQRFISMAGIFGVGIFAACMGQLRNWRTQRALDRFAAPYARRPGAMTPETRPRRVGWRVPIVVRLAIAAALAIVLLVLALVLAGTH